MCKIILTLCIFSIFFGYGLTGYTLTGLVHDFPSNPTWSDAGLTPLSTVDSGIVQNTLGTNGKPVYNLTISHPTVSNASSFGQWFTNVSGLNLGVPINITFSTTLTDPNTFYFTSNPWYPLTGKAGLGNDATVAKTPVNLFYTFELHAVFTYP
jgi:hypothetical protein